MQYEIGTKFKSLSPNTGMFTGTVVTVTRMKINEDYDGQCTYYGDCGLGVDHKWVEQGLVEVVQ